MNPVTYPVTYPATDDLNYIEGLRAEIERLRADNGRLRDALRNIIRGYGGECGCYEVAHFALERGKP